MQSCAHAKVAVCGSFLIALPRQALPQCLHGGLDGAQRVFKKVLHSAGGMSRPLRALLGCSCSAFGSASMRHAYLLMRLSHRVAAQFRPRCCVRVGVAGCGGSVAVGVASRILLQLLEREWALLF